MSLVTLEITEKLWDRAAYEVENEYGHPSECCPVAIGFRQELGLEIEQVSVGIDSLSLYSISPIIGYAFPLTTEASVVVRAFDGGLPYAPTTIEFEIPDEILEKVRGGA